MSEDTIKRTRPGRAVVIGDASLDFAGTRQPTMKTLRPYDAGGGTIHSKCGGVGYNTALNLARLGHDSHLISVFGDDDHGRRMKVAAREAGVNLSASTTMAGQASSTCLILSGGDGEPFYTLADVNIVERLHPALLHAHDALLGSASLLALNTILPEDTLAWLFRHYSDRAIFVDTVNAARAGRIRYWLDRIHTLKPNRAEASLLSGLPFESREHAAPVAEWFHRAGVVRVVFSLGAHGLYYSDGEHAGWLEPLPVGVVNVTGAGDALLAGLAHGWLDAQPFAESVRFANACAALTLTTRENTHPQLSAPTVRALMRRTQAGSASPIQHGRRPAGPDA